MPRPLHRCGEGNLQKYFRTETVSVTAAAAEEILTAGTYKNIIKTRYVNDKQITDHYAIIPTGQGLNSLNSLPLTSQRVYEVIVRRFLCIFYPPAVYQKVSLVTSARGESFFSSFKVLHRRKAI